MTTKKIISLLIIIVGINQSTLYASELNSNIKVENSNSIEIPIDKNSEGTNSSVEPASSEFESNSFQKITDKEIENIDANQNSSDDGGQILSSVFLIVSLLLFL